MLGDYTVYMHIFPNNKAYVGITRQDPETRWGKQGQGYKHQPVYDAILEYGWENVQHLIIYTWLDQETAQQKEKELIFQFDSIEHGYNISQGGGCGGDSWCEFEYNGVLYSAEELAEMSIPGVTAHDITTRINQHKWSIEKAINTPKITKGLYEYNGKLYKPSELLQYSKVDDMNARQLANRLRRWNGDVERALTQPFGTKKQPRGVGECVFEYQGNQYTSYELEQLSKVPGLTAYEIVNRINHHGWSVEDAITRPLKNRVKIFYNGDYYDSKEIAAMNPDPLVTHHTVTDRLSTGWTVDRIINTPLHIN